MQEDNTEQFGKILFVPSASNQLEVVADEFVTYTPEQISGFLRNEFGNRYSVSTAEKFVVVHPWGSPNVYAKPFKLFFERFVYFFQSNGVKLKSPDTPLVALILRSRNDFDRYLIKEINVRDSRVKGYYSRITNRIMTYDPGARVRTSDDPWLFNASSIIHEATHQTAFNTGVHNRFAPPPKWLSEGLATLFEAKGFNHSEKFTERLDRVNTMRLAQIRQALANGSINAELINLIANERLFSHDAELAYALSWALSFYLYEAQPKKYFEFIQNDAKRKNFSTYSPDQRMRIFMESFNMNFDQLENRLREHYSIPESTNGGGQRARSK